MKRYYNQYFCTSSSSSSSSTEEKHMAVTDPLGDSTLIVFQTYFCLFCTLILLTVDGCVKQRLSFDAVGLP